MEVIKICLPLHQQRQIDMKITVTIPSEKAGVLEAVKINILGDFDLVTDRIALANDNITGWEILTNLQSENQITIL